MKIFSIITISSKGNCEFRIILCKAPSFSRDALSILLYGILFFTSNEENFRSICIYVQFTPDDILDRPKVRKKSGNPDK